VALELKGVVVESLPGARQRGTHLLQALLETAAAPFEDPHPYVP
jgi:hypothetical protein